MSILTFTGSLLTTLPTSHDIQGTSLFSQLGDVSVGGAATNALLKWTGSNWVAATTISPDTVNTTTITTSTVAATVLNTVALNTGKLVFDSSQDSGMDHDMDYLTSTGKVLSGDASDRYLNLEVVGLTSVAKSDILSNNWSGYGAQTRYSFKYNDTGTNDAKYALGDIRFQYNYNATGTDNTDMSIRVYPNGETATNIKLLQVKVGTKLVLGHSGTGSSDNMIDFRPDRFRLLNHAGDIRLDTTGGDIRLKSNTKIDLQAPAKLNNLASAPSSPEKGWIYFNTDSNKAQCFDGANWQNLW